MKIFTKKGILQKTIIALVILILFNCIAPTLISRAENDGDGFGGVLFTPIQYLLLGIGDVGMWILGSSLYGNSDPVITLSTSEWWETAICWIGIISNPFNIINETVISKNVGVNITDKLLPTKIDLPLFAISPENIFANEVPLLDVNLINPTKYDMTDAKGNKVESTASILQETIASWYVALRNLAIIGLLSILVYVAIRIIISSTAADKAKYKQMFTDWLIAICLLFFLQYIMSFALTITDSITRTLRSSTEQLSIDLDLSKYNTSDNINKIINQMGSTDKSNVKWKTDVMGLVRFNAQLNYETGEPKIGQMGYTIMYIVLVIYTFMFLFQYLKRLMNIVFLTLMAPLVALTYPIDKMNDGKAQAFNMWLKEYVFNLLIQPMHLLLYTVLMGTAMSFVSEHPIYALAVLGFMLPGEKLFRKMFGFEKASTAGAVASGAFGGAMVMQGVNSVMSKIKSGPSRGKSGSSSNGNIDSGNSKIRMPSRTADNPNDEDKFITEGLSGGEDNKKDNTKEQTPTLDKYGQDGYGKNEQGEYFNPWTDEYDSNYDPSKDSTYANEQEGNSALDKYTSEGYGQNDQGEYFNPWTNEYDSNYDPTKDSAYATKVKMKNDDENNENKKIDNKPNYLKGAGTIAGKYAMKGAKGLGKAALKGTGMAIGAATFGALGVAAGLASDDYSNVAKWGAAGLTGGGAAGKAVQGRVMQVPSKLYEKASDVKDQVTEAAYKDHNAYQNYLNHKADKKFLNDKESKDLYKSKFGEGKYKEAMQAAIKYREHGITDNEIIINAMKVKNKNVKKDLTDRQRIISAKLATQVSGEKDVETISKRLKQKGIKDTQIENQADMIRKIKGLY